MLYKASTGAFLLLVNIATSTKLSTTHGTVEGKTLTLFNGKEVNAYLGILYAAAPIGKYRFASPKPLTPWNGTLLTMSLPSPCYQAATEHLKKNIWFITETPESEDCLYLNMWVPLNEIKREKMAIMILIHPGGFFAGSTEMSLYDGSVLASEQNVIVVSMNYRLSLLGFLYLNSSQVPGNMGLQDQIQAITWIKNNAEVFGGDSDRITLFGESAGSISIGFHLTNTNVFDLFHNAIMESGSVAMPGVTHSTEEALAKALSLGKSLNCSVEDESKMLVCLRDKTPEELFKGHLLIPKYLDLEFTPVRNGIEVPLSTETAAEDTPANKKKDLLAGDIPNDGTYFIGFFVDDRELDENLIVNESDFRTIMKDIYGLDNEILQNIVLFQLRSFDRSFNGSQLRREIGKFISDVAFTCPQIHFTKAWVTNTNNVYYYSFRHKPSRAYKKPIPEWAGAVHGDEIPFVFGLPLNPQNCYPDTERTLSMKVMDIWGNFAKTGNPNGIGTQSVIWPRIDLKGNFTTFVIDNDMSIENNFMEESCTFWEVVFPDILKLQNKLCL